MLRDCPATVEKLTSLRETYGHVGVGSYSGKGVEGCLDDKLAGMSAASAISLPGIGSCAAYGASGPQGRSQLISCWRVSRLRRAKRGMRRAKSSSALSSCYLDTPYDAHATIHLIDDLMILASI